MSRSRQILVCLAILMMVTLTIVDGLSFSSPKKTLNNDGCFNGGVFNPTTGKCDNCQVDCLAHGNGYQDDCQCICEPCLQQPYHDCMCSPPSGRDHAISFSPAGWEMPSTLDYYINSSDTLANTMIVTITVKAIHSGTNSLPVLFDHLDQCQLDLHDGTDVTYTSHTYFHDGASSIRYELHHSIRFMYLKWKCDGITVHPSRIYQLSDIDNISLKILFFDGEIESPTDDDAEHISDFTLSIRNDRPAMVHHYYWDQASYIVTRLTFFRPTSMKHNDIFYISHPLLNMNHIQSMHVPANGDKYDDLLRLTRLLGDMQENANLRCSRGSHSSTLEFQSDLDGQIRPQLKLPSEMPPDVGDAYSCVISLRYPPDVLDALMTWPNQSTLMIDIEPIGGDAANGSNRRFFAPTIIPQGSMSAETPQLGLLWISPHHKQDSAKDFEFGLATTRYVYNNAGGIEKIPQVSSILTLYSTIMQAGGSGDVIPLGKWSPLLECRGHVHAYNNHDSVPIDIVDGNIDLAGFSHILGSTCRLQLQAAVPDGLDAVSIRFTTRLITDGQSSSPKITVIASSFYGSNYSYITLYDTRLISLPQLPQLPRRFGITTEVDPSTGVTFGVIRMNLQLLLPYQIIEYESISIQLVFADYVNLSAVKKFIRTEIEFYEFYSVVISSRGIQVSQESALAAVIGVNYEQLYPTMEADEISNIFRPGMPIYSPSYVVQFPMGSIRLDPSQPLEITFRFPIKAQYKAELEATSIYAVSSSTSAYNPGIAIVTPPTPTALTGYSYRCVTWGQMASTYVYGAKSLPLTNQNSFECPLYDHSGSIENVDVSDPNIWRRVKLGTSSNACFYELAAVCVTPSTTPDQYNVHPIADCPSFLGQTHAIPCSLVEGNNPSWSHSLTEFTVKVNGDESFQSPTVEVFWLYEGDARLLLKLQARVQPPEETLDTPWVVIASTIPAFLFPSVTQGNRGLTIPFPRFNTNGRPVEFQLVLDGADRTELNAKPTLSLHEKHIAGCTPQSNKIFDPDTNLCVCATGFESSKPSGMDNPFIHPNSFDCLRQCNADTTRNPRTNVCEPNLPDAPVCHAVPKDIVPPFRTNSCGYGAPDEKKCTECRCLSRWMNNSTDGKCDICKLSLEEHCMQDNTDSISFQPEYCWVGRCLCKTGFYGDRCKHKVIYGTIQYVQPTTTTIAPPTEDTEQNMIILTRTKLAEIQDRIITQVKLVMDEIATDVDMFIQQATQQVVHRDPTGENTDEKDLITSIVIGMKPQQSNDGNGTPFVYLDDTTNEFGHLYDAWQHVQDNGATLPPDAEFGQVGGVQPPFDPHCALNAMAHCPEGEDNLLPAKHQVDPDELDQVYEEDPDNPIIDISDDDGDDNSGSNTTTYIIIGVVVGVVLLLFVLLIVAIMYCRKHNKMCFRKRRGKGDAASGGSRSVELASSNNNKSNTATPASAAPPPSSTMSTSSYLPTQVQVEDPTLPADWVALEDKSTGKVYYSNKVTMESSWDHPAKPKEKAAGNAYGW